MIFATQQHRKPSPVQALPARRKTLDHDLPVLAASENLPRPPAWDELLERGVQPCLVLGAERRSRGNR
jgi:hypothetical protein